MLALKITTNNQDNSTVYIPIRNGPSPGLIAAPSKLSKNNGKKLLLKWQWKTWKRVTQLLKKNKDGLLSWAIDSHSSLISSKTLWVVQCLFKPMPRDHWSGFEGMVEIRKFCSDVNCNVTSDSTIHYKVMQLWQTETTTVNQWH